MKVHPLIALEARMCVCVCLLSSVSVPGSARLYKLHILRSLYSILLFYLAILSCCSVLLFYLVVLYHCSISLVYCCFHSKLLSSVYGCLRPRNVWNSRGRVQVERVSLLHFPFSSSSFNSLVQDPRGPAPFLCIRADIRDIFGEPDVKQGR